jgi:hypothetical protein
MRFSTDSSPFRQKLTDPIMALLVSAMLIMPATNAYADDNATGAQDSERLKRQILESLDEPNLELEPEGKVFEDSLLAGFGVSKKGPIRYKRILQIGDDEVSIRLYGPMVKKKPGLRFKVEGLTIGEHPVRVEGYGNSKGGRVRFTVRF